MRGSSRLLRDVLLAVVAPAVLVAAIYLTPFMRDRGTLPFGFDTASYLWRTNLVHDVGIAALNPDTVGEFKALGSRPAYPVVLSVLRSSTAESSLDLAWASPALIAVLIGLGAAAFATDGLREPRWRSGAVGIAVAASAFIAWTAVGYATALAFDAIAFAVVLIALRVSTGGRGVVAGALLLAGGALQHWMFAAVLAALLAGYAALLAVSRLLRPDPEGGAPPDRGAERVAMMLALGLALAGLAFLLAPELPGSLPKVAYGGDGALRFIRDRMPSMALPITLPLAGAGALLLAGPFGAASGSAGERRLRRLGSLLLALWAALAVAGLVAWYGLHLSLPPYRWAAFALGIPALIVLGLLVLERGLAHRFGVAGGVAGAILSIAAVVGLAGAGAAVWWHREPLMNGTQFAQLATADAYVRSLPDGVPIVVLIERGRRAPLDIIRAGLPAARIPEIATASARILPDGSIQQDPAEAALVPSGAVVLVLNALSHSPTTPTGTPLGPGVTLIAGPPPAAPIEPGVPPRAPSGPALFLLCVALVGVLTAAGSGWSAGLTDLGWLGSLTLAPTFGLAVLGLSGMAASRLGVPLSGGGGVGVVLATSAGGWIAWASVRRRGRPGPEGGPERIEPGVDELPLHPVGDQDTAR